MPRAWARRTTSFTGTSVPSMFDMWVIATSLVRGDSSFSNSSTRKLPSSSTGAHFLARILVRLGRGIGEVMQAAMHIGVFGGVGVRDALQHRLRLLRRGGV